MEMENTRVSVKCKQLLDEKKLLEESLRLKENYLEVENLKNVKLKKLMADFKEQLCTQEEVLVSKEREILDLQSQFKIRLQNEACADEVHRLSVSYHEEINFKTTEIATLKNSLFALQEELLVLSDLQIKNEEQERLIENLNFSLETRKFECDNLQQTDMNKTQQISELQSNLEKYQIERDNILEQLHVTQLEVKSVQKELIVLNDKYASMCALCERTKFELQIREIEYEKEKFQSINDERDIQQLREKLKEYLVHISELSKTINRLENDLEKRGVEKEEVEKKLNIVEERCTRAEYLVVANDEDMKSFQIELLKNQEKDENLRKHSKAEGFNVYENTDEEMQPLEIKGDTDDNQENVDIYTPRKESSLLTNKIKKDIESVGLNKNLSVIVGNLETPTKEDGFLEEKLENGTHKNEISQLQEKLQTKTQECENLKESIKKIREDMQRTHQKLLKNDAELYRVQKYEQKLCKDNSDAILTSAEDYSKLKNENENLKKEIKNLERLRSESEPELNKDKQVEALNKTVKQTNFVENGENHLQKDSKVTENVKLLVTEISFDPEYKDTSHAQAAIHSNFVPSSMTIAEEDVMTLNARVRELEEQLQYSTRLAEEKGEERVQLIKKLLEEQSYRVQQVTETKAEWEELLRLLTSTQEFEENTRKELEFKTAELEELNELFEEQNAELEKLQEFALLFECKRHEEFKNLETTFQQQIIAMQSVISDKIKENDEQKCIIEELELKGAHTQAYTETQPDVSDNYEIEVIQHGKEIKALQARVEQCVKERDEFAERMQEMTKELYILRQHNRDAVLLPEIMLTSEMGNECNTGILEARNRQGIDNRLRILTKVLESEHRRKMKRYDLHIRTLLNNVKSLKKALKTAEQKTSMLNKEHSKWSENLHDFQMSKRQLEEMRLKFEQSQCTIKTLEQALETERKKFEASDLGKSVQQEPAHEVANLIDDYKKLIQQSAVTTRRPKTSAIVELIQRSNQCVPNLNKLETAVDELRNDIQYFIENYSATEMKSTLPDTLLKVPSLMDELRAATDNV